MKAYDYEEVCHGVGIFDQAMRSQKDVPGFARRMSPNTAIGIIASAINSGMPASLVDELPERFFNAEIGLLKKTIMRCEGDNWDFDLWHRSSASKYKLSTGLCVLAKPIWRYNKYANESFD